MTAKASDALAELSALLEFVQRHLLEGEALGSIIDEKTPTHRNERRLQGRARASLAGRQEAVMRKGDFVVNLIDGGVSDDAAMTAVGFAAIVRSATTFKAALGLLAKLKDDDPNLYGGLKPALLRAWLTEFYAPSRRTPPGLFAREHDKAS